MKDDQLLDLKHTILVQPPIHSICPSTQWDIGNFEYNKSNRESTDSDSVLKNAQIYDSALKPR